MSNTAERVWNLYKDLSDTEDEFTVKDDLTEYQRKEEEEENNNIIILHPHCNKCNKFHKKETECKSSKGTVSI